MSQMTGLLLLRGMVEKLGKSRTGFNNHHIHGVKRTMQPGFSGAVIPVINNNNYQHLLSCHYSSFEDLRNNLKYLVDSENQKPPFARIQLYQGSMNDPAVTRPALSFEEQPRQEIEKELKEMQRRQKEFHALKPTMVSSSAQLEIEDIAPPSSQVGLQAEKGRFQWTDDMDQVLVDSLLEIVLAGPRRGENGFTDQELSTVVHKVHKCCHVVLVQNVRARLKTLQKDLTDITWLLKSASRFRDIADPFILKAYLENVSASLKTLKKDCTDITELLKSASGFGLDSTGRVMADPLVWEAYLKNVRARLKTLQKDLTDITELLKSTSGFGLDSTGRVMADPLVWEAYLKNVSARLKTLEKDCTGITELLKSASGFGLDSTGQVMADPLVWEAYLKNVRARLKTLKKDCTDITELLKSTSGFGLDSTGRVMADPLVWEAYLKEKPDARNLKRKLCPRYHDLVTIFGNESATGHQAVTGNDFPQVSEADIDNSVDADLGDKIEAEEAQPSQLSTSKRTAQGGGLKAQRRRGHAMDDVALALVRIAQSFEKIAIAFEKQATQSHVNGQAILEKLRAMGIEEGVQ